MNIMATELQFGTFNVPALTDETLSASYSAPSILPKAMRDKISLSDEIKSDIDKTLKTILSAKPKKRVKTNA